MGIPRPSRYQLFLIVVILIIFGLLLTPILFPNEQDDNQLKIGIIDSGCTINQRSDITEFETFTTTEYGYSFSETSFYDTIGHGKFVCQIILEGTSDVSIYSAKIANVEGEITYKGLFAAVDYLVNDVDADIINLSLGGEPYMSEQLLTAFEDYASSKVFIAAVGNKAQNFDYPSGMVDWPANLPWVIGVGADTETGRAPYSSYGRGNIGLYSTDFVADGSINGASGTSFATPRITVSYANMWQQLVKDGKTVTPELLSYYLASSTNATDYSAETGWGRPNPFVVKGADVYIEGVDEFDPFIRFQNETWTRSWKLFSMVDSVELELTGNATDVIDHSRVIDNQWADILEIKFVADADFGTYTLSVGDNSTNRFYYNFTVLPTEPDHRILLDHRHTINGLAHEYGQYFRFEKLMREYGIEVDQIQNGYTDLESFDSVLITEFGKSVKLHEQIGRYYNSTLIDTYMSYVHEGGNIQVLTTFPSEFHEVSYGDAMRRFGAITTEDRIPNDQDEISYVQNLTEFDIFEGVTSLGIGGTSLESVNSSQSVLGWYKSGATDIFGSTRYLGIGVNTTYGQGTIFVWSGSVMLQNEHLIDQQSNFDRFVLNYLDLLS